MRWHERADYSSTGSRSPRCQSLACNLEITRAHIPTWKILTETHAGKKLPVPKERLLIFRAQKPAWLILSEFAPKKPARLRSNWGRYPCSRWKA